MTKVRKHNLSDEVRQAFRGEALRQLRELGTQEALAGAIGVTQQAVSNLTAKGEIGAVTAEQFCQHLHVTKELLLERLRKGAYVELFAEADAEATKQRRRAPQAEPTNRVLPKERRDALEAEDWSGALPAEYTYVHDALMTYNFASGAEPVTAYWRSRVAFHRAEFKGGAERDVIPGDPQRPDPRVSKEKRLRLVKRTSRRP